MHNFLLIINFERKKSEFETEKFTVHYGINNSINNPTNVFQNVNRFLQILLYYFKQASHGVINYIRDKFFFRKLMYKMFYINSVNC